MSSIPDTFRAFRIHDDDEGYRSGLEDIAINDLSEGEVTIQVGYSGINFKDALAATGKGKILRQYPLAGGIDVAGVVVESGSDQVQVGDRVLANGSGLSEVRDGGYSEYLRLTGDIVVPLPETLSMREAMGLGTAGFTAAMSLDRMEANGQRPDMGPILVTGASGGVGTIAINLLTAAGYEAHAITGKVEEFDWLEHLGARQCISRHELHWGQKPLEKASWAGCIDSVGGDMLAGISRVIDLWGSIACCGMAGGHALNTTVFPLILRGVSLLGISSANCPIAVRRKLWNRLGHEWKPPLLDEIITREVTLDDMGDVFNDMMKGRSLGRTVVKISDLED
ncbi:MAG: YhdH/YhfP family quinone oxidoreductase [Xanthomonadales bacterium]|nr:YhdH/YhfP family quinone oxidoreductase [Gammaproteobacteria bacterium]MBT8053890.1 YhdH/YhfP family quinone oxidoreductase [Gammaproteobacteria bacterium]NND55997.1 YhdH/YhfP family quinone oxidoreductase [Xanthomonadales bacterium]NNK52058.1 YhdH/YhfP family quinone oxidoreductase [Xanthomonadales bacterium]